MRVALCLSGHLRSFHEVWKYFQITVANTLNCDIFIHTWDSTGSPTGKDRGDLRRDNAIDHINRLNIPYKDLLIESEGIFESFKSQTNNINIAPHERCFIARHIGYHVGMFYSLFKANELKNNYERNNNFRYDRVIRCRPDIRFGTVFNSNMFPNPEVLYVPKIGSYIPHGINDQVAIASSHIMDRYCDSFHNVIRYYRDRIVEPRPEAILKHYLDTSGVRIEKKDITYDIYRPSGDILRQHEFHGEILGVKWN